MRRRKKYTTCCAISRRAERPGLAIRFNFERQLVRGERYVVLAVNYRGSSGRGEKYQVGPISAIGQ